MKILTAILLCLTLQSCALTNPLDFFKEEPKIETNVQLGKTNESEQNKLKIEQSGDTIKQDADTISNDTSYKADVVNQITKNLGFWELVLLIVCAGFAIPSYKEVGMGAETTVVKLYSGLKVLTTDILNGIIVTPVRGTKNFILELFGRRQS